LSAISSLSTTAKNVTPILGWSRSTSVDLLT
jgi:hypothetical protein